MVEQFREEMRNVEDHIDPAFWRNASSFLSTHMLKRKEETDFSAFTFYYFLTSTRGAGIR